MRTSLIFLLSAIFSNCTQTDSQLAINDKGYFSSKAFDVLVSNNDYPQGHQSGIELILHGKRLATNGDIRLEPTPGQWSPVPELVAREVDTIANTITSQLSYPDPSKNRTGFNPIKYPDLEFSYDISVETRGHDVIISASLDEPLPQDWVGKVGFNLQIFPEHYFGKNFYLGDSLHFFPRQPAANIQSQADNSLLPTPIAKGDSLAVAPGSKHLGFQIVSQGNPLKMYDGRVFHNNGWYIVRSLIPANKTTDVVKWVISPRIDSDWSYSPVIQVSQLGYHPDQKKTAIIEADPKTRSFDNVNLVQIFKDGTREVVKSAKPEQWGDFLRYRYAKFDFTEIQTSGTYKLEYQDQQTHTFQIKNNIYNDNAWQPTLEYYLPVQMCHMRVNHNYRVWHGLCHQDDALMAPTDTNHFDGYKQGSSTLTNYNPLEPVNGLNRGGWHDAGDYDIRVESQAGTIYKLALVYDLFKPEVDVTSINQKSQVVELHRPDGKNDILQQIEHGLLSINGGYNALGRLYRGIIVPTLDQYVLLGDASVQTDGKTYDPDLGQSASVNNQSGVLDDRLVFTEDNPSRAMQVAQSLAAASNVVNRYNEELSRETLHIAKQVFQAHQESGQSANKINAAIELFAATQSVEYRNIILDSSSFIVKNSEHILPTLSRAMHLFDNSEFENAINQAAKQLSDDVSKRIHENPYGVPFPFSIWGKGWMIQEFGVNQYLLHRQWPELFPKENYLNALEYILGTHPGSNTAAYASGIGANSLTTAYGINRGDWSYIPGGVASGTALILPDLPELKNWPFFWQQTEYVMGGGGTNYLLLTLAAHHSLSK